MIIRFRLLIVIALALLAALILAPLQWIVVSTRLAPASAIASLYCRFLCRLIGLRINQISSNPLPKGPALIAPNHVSWTDILVLAACGATSFLAKKEVGGWPVVGVLARLQGVVFVDRERRRSIIPANKAMADVLKSGGTVVLFPEGTTNDGLRLKPFRSSHFEAGRIYLTAQEHARPLTLTAVALDYSRRHGMAASRAERARMAWYGETGLVPHLLDLLHLGYFECRISVLPAIRIEQTANRKDMARQSGALLQSELRRLQSGEADRSLAGG